jgi:ADP-ribose pyrophosphatase YjhB (NUDIX family)
MKERYTLPVAVYLIVSNSNNEILLLKRQNTWFLDWYYWLISWHKEKDENILQALVRETKEEADIDIDLENIKFVSVMNRKAWDREYIDYFFTLNYDWEYKNMESNKCEHLKFFSLDNLPEKIIDYIKYVIDNMNSDDKFLLYWW